MNKNRKLVYAIVISLGSIIIGFIIVSFIGFIKVYYEQNNTNSEDTSKQVELAIEGIDVIEFEDKSHNCNCSHSCSFCCRNDYNYFE